MLFWSRRLGPHNIFNVSNYSVRIYREIQTLCIYKYGKTNENIVSDSGFGTIPSNLENYYRLPPTNVFETITKSPLKNEIVCILSDVIRIEILSHLYLNGTQFYRIINKGGVVSYNPKIKEIECTMSDDLRYLINLYDSRLTTNNNLFSMTGAHVKTNNTEEGLFFPHFNLNVNHSQTLPLIKFDTPSYNAIFMGEDNIEVQANYIISTIDLKNVYEFLQLFNEDFLEFYSFSVKDFIVFLGFISQKLLSIFEKRYENQLHAYNRAYFTLDSNLEKIEKSFYAIYPEIYKSLFKENPSPHYLNEINFKTIINQFILGLENKKDLFLWTRGPKRMFYQLTADKLIIDYTLLSDIIAFIVKEITQTDGEVGNLRALFFENAIKKEIESLFEKESIWATQRVIKGNDLRKEIDASFIIDDVLFILEGKAINVSFGYEMGDKRALQYRVDSMKKALIESNEKAEFIKTHFANLSLTIPESIKYVCPLVISSHNEYIWEKTEELFISLETNFPRIITIEDIKHIKSIDLDKLRTKNWVIKLK